MWPLDAPDPTIDDPSIPQQPWRLPPRIIRHTVPEPRRRPRAIARRRASARAATGALTVLIYGLFDPYASVGVAALVRTQGK